MRAGADQVTYIRSAARACLAAALLLAGTLAADARAQDAAVGAPAEPAPLASAPVASVPVESVPTVVDTLERGLRLRTDVWGRFNTIGRPNPPVRLEVDDIVNDESDTDVSGVVIFGYDRPFGVPIVTDLMGDFNVDVGGDSPVSPFLDQASAGPQARLYSAFIGLSGGPGELLEPYKLNLGRMTELVESPVTYDGVAAGGNWRFPKLGWLNAKVWGGLDAPQFLPNDPFSRTDRKAYAERYLDDSGFVSATGALQIERSIIDADGDGVADALFNPVGGLVVEGRFAGVGVVATHALLPTVQRSRTGASYAWEADLLSFIVGADVRWSDFLPRSAALKGDLLTGDGTTRVGLNVNLQFLEDVCAYDCTFKAFNPANQIDQVIDDQGVVQKNDFVETFRVRDQIRHLNIGPSKEHFAALVDVERQFPSVGITGSLHGRVRQHFDAADLDYFRSDIYEAGAGVSWSTGFAVDIGTDVTLGTLSSGIQDGLAYDLFAEGLTSYLEDRTWARTVILEGKLSNLSEVFIRRHDVQTKAVVATGQYSAGLASTLRYDLLDFWSVSARIDADALAPVDTLNGSGYLGALVGTSVRF
jgi:hypothetical protein